MTNEKGITLIVLIVSVLMLAILASAAINYGTNSLREIKFQNFSYELQQIQGRVDAIYEKMKMENEPNYIELNGIKMGANITASGNAVETLQKVKGINYKELIAQSDKNLYPISGITIYRYFSKTDLERFLDIRDPEIEVIINFKTREVISVDGFEYDERLYYRLVDF